MNISNQVEHGIIKAVFKIGMAATAGLLIANTAPKIINAGEKTYNDVKDRIETEQAIRAEGIQAKSFAEAKMQLDSIRLARICAELGVDVPQKPAKTGDITKDMCNEMIHNSQVEDIYNKALIDKIDKISK